MPDELILTLDNIVEFVKSNIVGFKNMGVRARYIVCDAEGYKLLCQSAMLHFQCPAGRVNRYMGLIPVVIEDKPGFSIVPAPEDYFQVVVGSN